MLAWEETGKLGNVGRVAHEPLILPTQLPAALPP
jgi:hypothetical protein